MHRLTCVLFSTYHDAERAVAALTSSGIDTTKLSIILHEQTHLDQMNGSASDVVENAGRGALVGSATGALLGGLILGPLGIIGAGPLAAVLLAAGGAGFYGAIAGLLTGRDVNAPLVEALEQAIQAGKILVSVDDSDGKTTEQVRAVLAQCQPFECLEI